MISVLLPLALLPVGLARPHVLEPRDPAPWSIYGGYTAFELTSPGAHLGTEFLLGRAGNISSFTAAEIQFHAEPTIETGFGLHLRWGQRWTAPFGLTLETALGIGGAWTLYQTTVFVYEDAVAQRIAGSESRFSFTPQVLVGLGYDAQRLLHLPLHLYARPGLQLTYPELNSLFQLSALVEAGLRWTF